jgi:hypothetical protein
MKDLQPKRLNKEKVIEHKNFKLRFGTANKVTPSALYLSGGVFISPTIEKTNYFKDIEYFKETIKKSIKSELSSSNLFDNRFIYDFDLRGSGLKVGKSSYLSFECHFKQNMLNELMSFDVFRKKTKDNINRIINIIEETIDGAGYIMTRTKL